MRARRALRELLTHHRHYEEFRRQLGDEEPLGDGAAKIAAVGVGRERAGTSTRSAARRAGRQARAGTCHLKGGRTRPGGRTARSPPEYASTRTSDSTLKVWPA